MQAKHSEIQDDSRIEIKNLHGEAWNRLQLGFGRVITSSVFDGGAWRKCRRRTIERATGLEFPSHESKERTLHLFLLRYRVNPSYSTLSTNLQGHDENLFVPQRTHIVERPHSSPVIFDTGIALLNQSSLPLKMLRLDEILCDNPDSPLQNVNWESSATLFIPVNSPDLENTPEPRYIVINLGPVYLSLCFRWKLFSLEIRNHSTGHAWKSGNL